MGTREQAEEIREAIQAANAALEHLHAAAKKLKSAGRWGVFDIFAGGFVSTAIKHGRMSEAQDEIDEAKDALRSFVWELRDVDREAGLNIEVGGFLQFADFFFDGPVADLVVQERISDARYQVNRAIREVEVARDRLCRM